MLRTPTRARRRSRVAVAAAASALLAGSPAASAWADQATITDPVNDTQMMRGGPDITTVKVKYTDKRVQVAVTYRTAAHLAYAKDGGTITGANLRFKNGKSYVLQRHAADPGRQSQLVNEILVGTSAKRVKCDGVKSKVATAAKRVTVSAPVSCFKGKGTKLKAQGFSFTVNYDVDEAKWSKRIKQG